MVRFEYLQSLGHCESFLHIPVKKCLEHPMTILLQRENRTAAKKERKLFVKHKFGNPNIISENINVIHSINYYARQTLNLSLFIQFE